MEKELRRNQISLVMCGTGVILLGVWSVLKVMLYFLAGPPIELGIEEDPKVVLIAEIVVFGLLGILMVADVWLRVSIGRAARAEGMGRPQKSRYLYLTLFVAIISILGLVYSVWLALTGGLTNQSRLDFAASCAVDLISTFLLFRLIAAAKRVRRLRETLEG